MILFILTVVAVIATWIIPAGAYSKLSYEPSSQELKIVNPHNQSEKVPGTQQELDKMGLKLRLNNLNQVQLISRYQFRILMKD